MKDKKDVVADFHEFVNMSADELETWLKSGDSNSAGWPKDDANGDGETVGHDSGRKIVEILKANPEQKEDEYTEDQTAHMRKVVAYWLVMAFSLTRIDFSSDGEVCRSKRHLAQETKVNNEKSPEEVKKTKSYVSRPRLPLQIVKNCES